MEKPTPTLLCILDGYGLRAETQGNAIAAANTPIMDRLMATCPHSQLSASGPDVGLPEGQMGNSEVGHTTIGAGRVIYQPLERIRKDLDEHFFDERSPFVEYLSQTQGAPAIHLIGLASNGGVHGHTDHIIRIAQLLNNLKRPVYIHAITDGRDTAPKAGKAQLKDLINAIEPFEHVHLASLIGRYFAMDRDTNWERTEKAYTLFTQGKGENAASAAAAFDALYRESYDEFMPPTTLPLPEGLSGHIQKDDSVFFTNFRADRMRQITRAITMPEFHEFNKGSAPTPKAIATMTEYHADFAPYVTVIYPHEIITNTLGECVSRAGLAQLRITETDKYGHVTYYLNGGQETPFDGEERQLIASPKVKTYAETPAMSLEELTQKVVDAIHAKKHHLIVLNITNGDQVGHSGNFNAAKQAVEHIDASLAHITQALDETGGQALIIADHGNCETMETQDGTPVTAHTTNPVPCIYVGPQNATVHTGTLANVAPAILTLMGLTIPEEMEEPCVTLS